MPRHGRGWAMENGRWNKDRHSPLIVSLLEPTLLVLIGEHPTHGYTLLTELNTMNMASIHPSVVYRTLREMELLGWIDFAWETDQTQGPPRKIYSLSAQGKEVLYFWKNELEKSSSLITQILNKIK